MPASAPVIVIPGITATYLRDQYPLPPEIVWSVLQKRFGRASLHPDDLRWEAREPARVVADQLFEIAYEELIEELRYNLATSEDDPVPVYPFGYDWRHPLKQIEAQLADFVEEVIERTKLMRNYHAAKYAENPKVNLVGHSMGGLVIGGYLADHGGGGRVGKVVSLASPFQGSFEAVIKAATGTANLGTDAPSSREREAARVTPALYHLMPSFENGLEVAPGLPKSLFDPGVWQPSILETLQAYIAKYGLDRKLKKAELKKRANTLFAGMLRTADAHRRKLNALNLANAGLTDRDWMCVIGVNATTRVRLRVEEDDQGKPAFRFRAEDRTDMWEDGASDAERRLTGDGTVPFEGAIPPFLPYERLICVTPDDYGYWEAADRAATRAAGFHGILPNMNMLHRLIVRFFRNAPDRRGNTWGRPAPGVAPQAWDPPLKLK